MRVYSLLPITNIFNSLSKWSITYPDLTTHYHREEPCLVQILNLLILSFSLSLKKKTRNQTEKREFQEDSFERNFIKDWINFQSFQQSFPLRKQKKADPRRSKLQVNACRKRIKGGKRGRSIDNQAQLPAMHRGNKFNSRCPRDRPRSKWPTSAEVEQDEEERGARGKRKRGTRDSRREREESCVASSVKGDLLTAPTSNKTSPASPWKFLLDTVVKLPSRPCQLGAHTRHENSTRGDGIEFLPRASFRDQGRGSWKRFPPIFGEKALPAGLSSSRACRVSRRNGYRFHQPRCCW